MSKDNEPRLQRISTELLEEYNDVELVASLLQELVEANDEVEVQLTFEKPLSRKGRNSKGNNNSRRGNNKRGGGKFDNKTDDHLKVLLLRKMVTRNLTVKINHLKVQTKL